MNKSRNEYRQALYQPHPWDPLGKPHWCFRYIEKELCKFLLEPANYIELIREINNIPYNLLSSIIENNINLTQEQINSLKLLKEIV